MLSLGRIIGWEEGNVSCYCVSIDIMLLIGGKLNKKKKIFKLIISYFWVIICFILEGLCD